MVGAAGPSGARAATQLCSPHTLAQHFSEAAQSWGRGVAQQSPEALPPGPGSPPCPYTRVYRCLQLQPPVASP